MNIMMGYIAGKVLGANRDTIARIMFYMINPIVVFNGIIHTKLKTDILILPILTFLISCGLCLVFLKIARKIWSDSLCPLVAYSAGSGATGYFGLPMALMLFDEQGEGVYIMSFLGVTFFENTLGIYIFSPERETAMQSVRKFLKLPALYALVGGLLFNLLHIPIHEIFEEFMKHVKGTYIVLGMMIVGLGLSGLTHFKIDFKFLGLTFLAKFLVWPAVILAIIFIDYHSIQFFNQTIYNALVLISIVPLAVNTVIIASLTNSYPEKAATAVLLSTILALFYLPMMAYYFIV